MPAIMFRLQLVALYQKSRLPWVWNETYLSFREMELQLHRYVACVQLHAMEQIQHAHMELKEHYK